MTLIVIDPGLCARDGICVAECPQGLLAPGEDGLPVPVPDADSRCIRCGHCFAVCPKGALKLDGLSPDAAPAVSGRSGLSPEAGLDFLTSRRSIRNWKDRPVPRELLEKALDAARYAPSGINMQPAHWLVVEDSRVVRELAGMVADGLRHAGIMPDYVAAFDAGREVMLRGAPHLVVAHADASGWYDPATDCVLALSHFELAAHALGFGTCWAGLFRRAAETWPPLRERIGLPPGHKVCGALMAGYPKSRFFRLPPRKSLRLRYL
ncbi:nitroreductase [Desulfovibrio sulfodismutans]|uniref:Nitroreductase n=1 Tax=Desulfolutivibrio sulfodismutans TaxID=63561 RepID=A0A7K3NM61_9BACT|nr:nitroreductase family protein [Desulfolutivibrio sulfodismutans]NDY57270.1 nitroreductase [Desulfolutivibrio sulfodismutans]QLA13674.1 nitroreductase [Desulfolutivibrio sulfodismutans DSM 3696]